MYSCIITHVRRMPEYICVGVPCSGGMFIIILLNSNVSCVVMLALGVCEFRWLLLLKNVSFRKMTCRKNKKIKNKK